MTVVTNTSIAIGLFRRSLLRLSSWWPAALAAMILATPGASLFEAREVERSESSNPVEERGSCTEFVATAESAQARRPFDRNAKAFRSGQHAPRLKCTYASSDGPGRSVSGHRLANGLCAPLLC